MGWGGGVGGVHMILTDHINYSSKLSYFQNSTNQDQNPSQW